MLVRARIEDDRWVATHASEPDPRDERRRCWIVASDTVGARSTRARFGLFVGRLRGPLVGWAACSAADTLGQLVLESSYACI